MDRLPFDFPPARPLPPVKRAKFPGAPAPSGSAAAGNGVPQPLLPFPRDHHLSAAAGGATALNSTPTTANGVHGSAHVTPGGAHGAHSAHSAHGAGDLELDEDERFLRLAREALVATATSGDGTQLVDPTIQDLLQRLQYALLPHGNPIRQSSKIEANSNGQLNIQGFYQLFPNLSNDIFMDISHPVSSGSLPLHPGGPGAPRPHSRTLLSEYDDTDDGKRFRCDKCSQTFRRLSDLKRHEKQHLLVPANICDLCGKGFARKDALKRHRDTQTCRRNAEKKLYLDNLAYR